MTDLEYPWSVSCHHVNSFALKLVLRKIFACAREVASPFDDAAKGQVIPEFSKRAAFDRAGDEKRNARGDGAQKILEAIACFRADEQVQVISDIGKLFDSDMIGSRRGIDHRSNALGVRPG